MTTITHEITPFVFLKETGTVFYRLDNEAQSGGAFFSPRSLYKAGQRLQEIAQDKGYNPEYDVSGIFEASSPVSPPPPPPPFYGDEIYEPDWPREPRYVNLTDQAKTIYRHMQRAGSISAREAMNDYGITSATLARRICDMEDEGFEIARLSKIHPIHGRRYTRYSFAGTRD